MRAIFDDAARFIGYLRMRTMMFVTATCGMM
jgi:hypothetical protein